MSWVPCTEPPSASSVQGGGFDWATDALRPGQPRFAAMHKCCPHGRAPGGARSAGLTNQRVKAQYIRVCILLQNMTYSNDLGGCAFLSFFAAPHARCVLVTDACCLPLLLPCFATLPSRSRARPSSTQHDMHVMPRCLMPVKPKLSRCHGSRRHRCPSRIGPRACAASAQPLAARAGPAVWLLSTLGQPGRATAVSCAVDPACAPPCCLHGLPLLWLVASPHVLCILAGGLFTHGPEGHGRGASSACAHAAVQQRRPAFVRAVAAELVQCTSLAHTTQAANNRWLLQPLPRPSAAMPHGRQLPQCPTPLSSVRCTGVPGCHSWTSRVCRHL